MRRVGRSVAVVGVLALVAAGLWLVVRETSVSRIRKVEIVGLAGPRAERLRAAALEQSTLGVDEDELRRAAAGKPEVRELEVETDFPDRAVIRVTLYTPVAAVGPEGSQGTPVTADGVVLAGVSPAGLPKITGTTLNGRVQGATVGRVLTVIAGAPRAFRRRIESGSWDGRRGVTLKLASGPLVYFGDVSAIRAKWASLARVLSDEGSVGATYVDVRVPRRPAVGGVPGAVTGGIDPADPSQSITDGAAAPGEVDGTDGGGAAPDGGAGAGDQEQ